MGLGNADADADAGRATLQRLYATLPEGGSGGSGTLLRSIDPDAVEIVGARDGITYGQWKGGPAGTLDIDVDFRFAPQIRADVRVHFERAAKVWARRIRDDFRTYTIPAGRTLRISERFTGGPGQGALTATFDEDVTTDGLPIPVIATDKTPWAAAGFDLDPLSADVVNTAEDFEPSLAVMFVNPDNRSLRARWADTAAHEIGHALGITAVRDPRGVIRNEGWLLHLDRTAHAFTGSNARSAHGGRPVPLQWLAPDGAPVPPGTAGAARDPGHLGVCNSIVSYGCPLPEVLVPTELDVAVLEDIGYETLDPGTASEPELYGFAARGRHSAWGVGVERRLRYTRRSRFTQGAFGAPYRGYAFAGNELRAGADAYGVAPDTTLGEHPSAAAPQQAVAWSGTLIGVDLGHEGLPPVFGNVAVSVDRATLEATVRARDLGVVVDGKSSPFRTRDLHYEIALAVNDFADDCGRVAGSLFGARHEEMAGTVHDVRSHVDLLAVLIAGTRNPEQGDPRLPSAQ